MRTIKKCYMFEKFFNFGLLKIQLVSFDTQDNIFRIDNAEYPQTCEWQQNLNLDTSEKVGEYGLRCFEPKKIWFKSDTPLDTIRLNGFKYKYRVKKISSFHFIIESNKFDDYFDGTDMIEVIAKMKLK